MSPRSFEEIERKLFYDIRLKQPVSNGNTIDKAKGYYAIWITDASQLPSPFSDELKKRDSNLLYIGIAEITLFQRLLEQELQHYKAATFFRSLGAVLKKRPTPRSLVGKSNQNNYRFSKKDTDEIIQWNDKNLEVSFCQDILVNEEIEISLIKKHNPLFNWKHNPNKFQPLKKEKDECRFVARNQA